MPGLAPDLSCVSRILRGRLDCRVKLSKDGKRGALRILAIDGARGRCHLGKIDAAGFDKLTFAWVGADALHQGHYYRVQGPTFLIEFDNTQNNANHAHSVWRDFDGDFGRDLLREHLRAAHP